MKLQEILKARGITDEQLKEVQEQDIPAAAESFQRIMDIYYLLKVTADMESAYWYNRVWWENDGDLLEVRRAKAVAASLAHSTPTILPYEKLVMNKTKHLRGAFPFPWVCASFFNSLAESLMEEAEAPAENEADSVSVVGAGGGNVTESYGEVISIAKKFGMRKEDIPVLVKVSKYWDGISVEDISTKYAKTLPGFEQFQNIMDSVLVMFDSFAIPQGREVMNYYMPLQYGFDGILELCDEKIAETMGEAGGDGVLGMSRGYYYAAMKEIVKGLSQWCENYARKAEDLASREPDEAYKKNYLEIAQVMHNIAHKCPSTFREALQMTLCLHLGVVNEDPQSGQSIGRLGQVLQPFLKKTLLTAPPQKKLWNCWNCTASKSHVSNVLLLLAYPAAFFPATHSTTCLWAVRTTMVCLRLHLWNTSSSKQVCVRRHLSLPFPSSTMKNCLRTSL